MMMITTKDTKITKTINRFCYLRARRVRRGPMDLLVHGQELPV